MTSKLLEECKAPPRRGPPQPHYGRIKPPVLGRPRTNFRDIALSRTPGAHCAAWAVYEERSCVVVLGPDDLRIFQAVHRLPLVLPWHSLRAARNGQKLTMALTRGTVSRTCCFCWMPAPYLLRVSADAGEAFWATLRDKGCLASLAPIPGPAAAARGDAASLLAVPGDALDVVSFFLPVPDIHEFSRACSILRKQLQNEDFWRKVYLTHAPAAARAQVEEFSDARDSSCLYRDRAALYFLRFCQSCYARRHRTGPCTCGALQPFNSLVRFDLGSVEKMRLRLSALEPYLTTHAFHLPQSSVRFSSRQHGSSLRQLLRRAAIAGRAHLLVCEGRDKTVFGAFMGFPLKRLSPSYGSGASFLFVLGKPQHPEVRVFPSPDADASLARSQAELFALGLNGESALGINDNLTEAFCEPSRWSNGEPLVSRRVALSSVTLLSDQSLAYEKDKKIAHVSDWGTDANVERNVAHFLLDLSAAQQSMRYHFD